MKRIIFPIVVMFLFVSCGRTPDLFYIVSTNVMSACDVDGHEVFNSRLIPEDMKYMDMENAYVKEHYAGKMRFFAPYYEQFTMNAIKAPKETYDSAYHHGKRDLYNRFEEYMRKENKGRPFFLMGFSQGAIIALDLLKEMPAEYYARCKGVYVMGYRVSTEELLSERVKPATDELSGNVVSFNSVMGNDASWKFVSDGAAACINPLNWRTDDVPATLRFDGDTATVQVDVNSHQLIVKGLSKEKYTFAPLKDFCKSGCLHHWDLLFYADAIRENMKKRKK